MWHIEQKELNLLFFSVTGSIEIYHACVQSISAPDFLFDYRVRGLRTLLLSVLGVRNWSNGAFHLTTGELQFFSFLQARPPNFYFYLTPVADRVV